MPARKFESTSEQKTQANYLLNIIANHKMMKSEKILRHISTYTAVAY